MKKWFLFKVYRLNKRLFVFFVLFLTGTLITNVLGWQVTPFYVWGMFSEKEASNEKLPVLRVSINDTSVVNYTKYTDFNRFFLTSPLQLYILMKKNQTDPTKRFLQTKLGNDYRRIENVADRVLNDSTEYSLFLPWYKNYLEETTGTKIQNFKIDLLHLTYEGKYKLNLDSTELIASWKQ